MFDHKHYIPILKTKAGERWAVERLTPGALQRLTPLFELHSHRSKGTEDHVEEICESFQAFWPADKIFFLDTILLATENGDPAVSTMTFDCARVCALPAVPVVRIGFTAQARASVRQIIQQDARGCLLRLKVTEVAQVGAVDALIHSLGLQPSDVHLLLDYGNQVPTTIVQDIAAVPHVQQWQTLTVASGIFPPSIINLPHNAWNQIARADWTTWEQAIMSGTLARKPSFGDFTIRDPGPPVDFGEASVNLRYTKAHYWLVRIGGKVKDGASPEMHDVCRSLVQHSDFDGATFSAGDAEIFATAQRNANPGNAGQWVQWCINHHLEFVTTQLRNHPGL